MKRIITFAVLFAVVAFTVASFNTQAVNQSFTEKFATVQQTKQEDASGNYNFDKAHSFIGFRITHMGLIEVPGYFRDFTGAVSYDAKNVKNSTVNFTAKMTSVDTGVAARDNHLRTKDFFEVETFPEMMFKSTKVEKKGKGLMVTGDFTMKGVTKSITFPAQIAGVVPDGRGGTKMGLTAETMINRRDYSVNYGSNIPTTSIPTLADNVKIVLQIEANKAK